MSKYEPLEKYLIASKEDAVALSFSQIEKILNRALPRSAFDYREWWANTQGSHVQAKAWMSAGYMAEDVDMEGKSLVFRRWQDVTAAAQTPRYASFADMMAATQHLRSKVKFIDGFDPTTPSQDIVDAPGWR